MVLSCKPALALWWFADLGTPCALSKEMNLCIHIRVSAVLLTRLAMVIISILWAGPTYGQTSPGIRSEFSQIGDASHFEFEGTGADRYKIERLGEKEIVLRVPSLDDGTIARLRAMQDAQVAVKSVSALGVDGQAEVRFTMAKGVDYFDYVSDQPMRLILDFFPAEQAPKDAKALSQTGEAKSVAGPDGESVSQAADPALPAKKEKASARRPAGGDFVIVAKQGMGVTQLVPEAVSLAEKIASRRDFERGVFDGGDPEFRRFTVKDYEIKESARLAARAALRIPYPMLDLGFPKLEELLKAPPIYEVARTEDHALQTENDEARLLATLFENRRQGLFLSTAKGFLKKYPKSQYDEIVRYMMADTHYDLWHRERLTKEENKEVGVSLHDADFEEAMGLYNNLIEKYPDSPLTTRTLLLVGYSYLERGDSFGALKTFQRFVRLKPDSKYAGQVKISIARAFMALNRWDDAIKELESVEKDAKGTRDRQEAAFRKGDVFFKTGDYNKSVATYDTAIKKYPEATGRFPNAFYNRAEAQFRSGKEREAIDSYRQFLQKFPEHRHGGYAMTRLGEMIETLVGADDRRVTGAFFESYFRYRATPGADIARMRVLMSRIPKMKDRELKDSLLEIDEIVKRDKDLPSIQEFKTITLADAFTARGEFDRATADLIRFYKENTQSRHLDLIKGRIVRNLAENIKEAVGRNDFFQSLRLYSRDQSGWLKGVKRGDLPFFAGRSYEQAGVYDEAAAYYGEALKRIEGTKLNDRDVFETEVLPESLHLRLAAVYLKEKKFSQAEVELKKTKSVEKLSPREKVEHADLASALAEERGQSEEAKKYLVEMIKLFNRDEKTAAETAPLHLRMARLALKSKDFPSVEKSVEQVLKLSSEDLLKASAYEIEADAALQRGKKREAINSYRALLEIPSVNSDAQRAGYDSVRYRLGQLFFENGDLRSAEKVWAELSKEESSVWHRLASEQLTGAKWRDENKKYIERIPAAADIR